jgi:TPR repeat protein
MSFTPNSRSRVTLLLVASVLCGAAWFGLARGPDIEFELGYAYETGNFHGWTPGFTQDYRSAARWLQRAADADLPRAQYRLGILHAHGWGVARDDKRAIDWFTRSARNDYAPACFHLGWMYYKGDGVSQDHARAIALLEHAADQGLAAAHLALGKLHQRGAGMPADAVQALKWHTLAVHFAQSRPEVFDNAAFATRALDARNALTAQMPPAKIEQSRALAREWLAKQQYQTHRS